MYSVDELKTFMYQNKLLNFNDTLIITGSFAVCCKLKEDMTRFKNGQSDIDLIVVLKDKKSILHLIDKAQIKLFLKNKINIINYSFPYGKGRNQLNIKYISYKDFDKLLSYDHIHYKSFRKVPLTKYKPCEEFACSNMNFDRMYYNENYDHESKGYILNFTYCPIMNNVYRFSNIHSMILNGLIVFDGCLIQNQYKIFIKKFLEIFEKLNINQQKHLLIYFVDKYNWNMDRFSKFIKYIKTK